jgi:hypothetical protein
LIDEIKKLAVAIDPDWARRRYESGLTGRKVVARRNPDGTANIGGYDLPVDRVAAAAARVDRLAKAARRAGHPDVLDHIRADLYLSLLDGEYATLSDEQILADLIARGEQKKARAAGEPPPEPDPAPRADPAGPSPTPAPTGKGVEIRVRLTTLIGLDRCPGELAGWGHVHAELAERLVAENTGGQWRYVLCDTAGHPTHTGLLRARPAGAARQGAGIVEIQVHAHDLPDLADDTWQPVITELRSHLHETMDRDGDRDKRVPGPALRRFLEVRHRTCVFPGCRMPAAHTDMDHSKEYGRGGETVEENLAPLCRHDHRVRHDRRWHVSQPEPGHITWDSPLGKSYQVPAKPVIEPLPQPVPPSDKDTYDFTHKPPDEHILEPEEPEERPDAPRPPPPPRAPIDDEEPPF